jgi:hypothetical protein
MNKQTIQQIQPIYTSKQTEIKPTFYSKTTPSCSSQGGDHHAATKAVTIVQQPGR